MTAIVKHQAETGLGSLAEIKRFLAECRDIPQLVEGHGKAAAIAQYLRGRDDSGAIAIDAAEIKLRFERRLGEVLDETVDHDGVAGKAGPGRGKKTGNTVLPVSDAIPSGIGKMQSHRWQKVFRVPEPVFEEYVARARESERAPTSAGALQLEARRRASSITRPGHTPELPQLVYRCLVIDPPWPMARSERSEEPEQGNRLDYATLSLEQIAAVPVASLADPVGCHLYLWVTHRFLPDGLRLLESWGFSYHCLLTWVKPSGMTPFSWMFNTEHVLFAHSGPDALRQIQDGGHGLKVAFEAPAGKGRHSTKPDVFFDRVLAFSPSPRLEMYARNRREGFDAWGNELPDQKNMV